MKTNSFPAAPGELLCRPQDDPSRSWRALVLLCSVVLGLASLPTARAEVPAPDNVLYGIVVLGNSQVTANSTAFTVEARRTNGLTVARYRMGDQAAAGNFYTLSVKVEEIAPCLDPGSVLVGEPLTILVASNSVAQAQQTFTVIERGQVTRLDFGAVPTNILTGFEAWAMALGLELNSHALDADDDRVPNCNEYVAGTNPNDPASKFLLRIARGLTNTQVSFDALRAEGTGYQGLNRHYALERLADLPAGTWEDVPGYSDLVGSNQLIVCSIPATTAPLFFRGKVWLAQSSSAGDLRLLVSRNAGQTTVSFTALGPDPQSQNRYYTLEHTTNLVSGAWVVVPGYSNVLGAGQTVTCSVPAAGTGRGFYRGRLELRNP